MANIRKSISDGIVEFFDKWRNETRKPKIVSKFTELENLIMYLITVDPITRKANGKWLGELLASEFGRSGAAEIRTRLYKLGSRIYKAESWRMNPALSRALQNEKFKTYRKTEGYLKYQREYQREYNNKNKVALLIKSRIGSIRKGNAHNKYPAISKKIMSEIEKFKSNSSEKYSVDHILPVLIFIKFGIESFGIISDPMNLQVIAAKANSVKGQSITRPALRIALALEKKHNLPGFGAFVADLYAKQQAEKEEVIETIVYNKNNNKELSK